MLSMMCYETFGNGVTDPRRKIGRTLRAAKWSSCLSSQQEIVVSKLRITYVLLLGTRSNKILIHYYCVQLRKIIINL
jgi:hypothetical protein